MYDGVIHELPVEGHLVVSDFDEFLQLHISISFNLCRLPPLGGFKEIKARDHALTEEEVAEGKKEFSIEFGDQKARGIILHISDEKLGAIIQNIKGENLSCLTPFDHLEGNKSSLIF